MGIPALDEDILIQQHCTWKPNLEHEGIKVTGNYEESRHLRLDELFGVIAYEMNVDILSIKKSTIIPPAAAAALCIISVTSLAKNDECVVRIFGTKT
jgi:hypothetical protein